MQKKNDCWWFGDTGKCHNFYILMSFVGVCTVTEIACLSLLVFYILMSFVGVCAVTDIGCLLLVLFSGDPVFVENTSGRKYLREVQQRAPQGEYGSTGSGCPLKS
jgi:hypothetical protein